MAEQLKDRTDVASTIGVEFADVVASATNTGNEELNVPVNAQDVIPLNYQTALASYTEPEQEEIMKLADSIDVRKIANVMSYGSIALRRTFDQCGKFLKDERGSAADQQVIAQVIELSKKASASYDDFNLVLKEPNFFQKLLLKISKSKRDSRTEKIQHSAITSYKLLAELRASCDSWLEMLQKAMGEIENSAKSDYQTIRLLEKYIIAGEIAKERIGTELTAIKGDYENTGLQQYAQDYQMLKEGYDIFEITMSNLDKSRVMYYLSIGQLGLIKRSNTDVQISIHTQSANSMALIGQQLRNAILNAKTREVLEGQKAIAGLNNELIKEISRSAGLTAEETERLIYNGFYNIEAAKEAVQTVVTSYKEIQKTATEMLPKMKADMEQIEGLIKELEPCVNSVENHSEAVSNDKTSPVTANAGELKF